jgi:hypothetical protein
MLSPFQYASLISLLLVDEYVVHFPDVRSNHLHMRFVTYRNNETGMTQYASLIIQLALKQNAETVKNEVHVLHKYNTNISVYFNTSNTHLLTIMRHM